MLGSQPAACLTASLRTDAQCVEILFEVAFLFSNSNLRQHLFGALNIYTLRLHIRKIEEMSGANPGRYSCDNKNKTLIQISRLFYFGFFSKTNHQMMI